MKIKVTFLGKLSGALGVIYPIQDTVIVDNTAQETIRLALYTGKTESGHAYESVRDIETPDKQE